MADVFDFYVKDNRTIQFKFTEPIMLEDSHVTDWVFHIPRILNNLDVSGWAWWLVYINARGQKYSELLELSEDPESPLEKCIATYSVDYGMSIKAGIVRFSLEAINAEQAGEIENEWHTKTYQTKVQDTLQGNQVEYAETESDIISALIVEVQNKVAQLVGGATPEPVSLISEMTDTKKVYLYVGEESGESNGYWYYYNGSAWVAGGLYASGITVDAVPTQGSTNAVSSGGVWSAIDGVYNVINLEEKIPIPFVIAGTGYIASNGNASTNSTIAAYTDYIDLSGYEKIIYKRKSVSASSTAHYDAFYDANKEFIASRRNLYNQETDGYTEVEYTLPQGTVYARFTTWLDTAMYGNFAIYRTNNVLVEKFSELEGTIADKVDKETGKGLSTNDYTSAEKTKLAGIESGATAVLIDSTPTQGSSNAVSSGGVYEALRNTDTTLTQSGQAADAKVVGDKINGLNSTVGSVMQNVKNVPIPFTVTNGKYISSTGGTGNSENAGYTDYIDISAYSKIRYKLINVVGGGNWGVALYNESYEMVGRKRYPYEAESYSYIDEMWETDIPEHAKYARFTTLADTVTYGEYEIYAINKIPAELERIDNKIDSEIAGLDFIKTEIKIGKNLYNPETATNGKYISSNTGNLSGNASYITTDFIPVTAENPIIVSMLRNFLAYDEQKNPISDTYVSTQKNRYVFTPSVDGFIRASLFVESALNNMIAYGSVLPDYEPYKETIMFEDDIHLSDTMSEDVEAIASATKGIGKKLTVIIDNDSYTLFSQYSDATTLKRTLSYGKRNNRTFEFDYAYIIDSNGLQTQIKESTDDITPLRLGANGSSRTVGANHGWVTLYVPVGNLTVEDTGSVWTDGTNNYILAKVDADYAYFVLPAHMTGDSFTYNTDTPATDLTHVSGATHTDEISIDGLENGNLYPSVNNRKHKIYADGVEIAEDGIYYCDKFTVWEQYNIMDYVDVGEYLQAHIGTDLLTADGIAGCVRQTIQYTFGETDCVIAHSTEALKDVYYVDCGFLQAIPSTFAGKNFYRYGNGVNENNPLYSANLLNQTSDSSGFNVTPSILADANVPMNRSVDLVKDNGNLAWGFTTGFIPDISYGANTYRKDLSVLWSFRTDTRKSYPCAFRYRHAVVGFYADIVGYRNYLRPGLDITNESLIEVGNTLYVIVDAHTQQINRSVKVPEKYLGKPIQVLEPVNFVLSSNIVGANGVVFSTTNNYGCAVLKISQTAVA